MLRCLAFATVFAATLCGCAGQQAKLRHRPLQGAARALDALGSLPQQNAPEPFEGACAPVVGRRSESDQARARDLLRRLDSYASDGRAAADAQAGWFALYADYRAVPKEARALTDPRVGRPLGMLSLVALLPDPANWLAMRAEAGRRASQLATKSHADDEYVSALALNLLFDSLLNDTAAQARALDALHAAAMVASKERKEQVEPIIDEWRRHLALEAGSDDPTVDFKRRLDEAKPDADCCISLDSLIEKAGAARARTFLEHALFERNIQLGFYGNDGTLELGQRLALQQPSRLARVQWGLVGGARALEAFYAMATLADCRQRNCVQETTPDFDRALALAPRFVRARLLRPLIEAGEDAHAERLLLEASDPRMVVFALRETWQSMVDNGQGRRALDFAHFFFGRHAATPYWSGLQAFGLATDQRLAEPAYALLALAPIDTADLEETRMLLTRSIVSEPDARNETAETALRLQQRLALPVAHEQSEHSFDDPLLTRAATAVQLADLGLLEQRDEWRNQGLATVQDLLVQTRAAAYAEEYRDDYARNQALIDAVRLLHESDRSADAEGLLLDELSAIGAACRAVDLDGCRDRFASQYHGRDMDTPARLLMALYSGVGGSSDDARALADRYPLWQSDDAASLATGSRCECGAQPGIAVADSLVAAGETERAVGLLHAILQGPDATPDAARLFGRVAGSRGTSMILQSTAQERGMRYAMAAFAEWGAGDKMHAREFALIARGETLYAPWRGELDALLADAAMSEGDRMAAARWRDGTKAHVLAYRAARYEQLGVTTKARALYSRAIELQQAGDCIESGMLALARKRGDRAEVSSLLRQMSIAAGTDASRGAIGCLKGYLSLQPEEYATLLAALAEAAKASPTLAFELPTLRYALDADCDLSSSVESDRACVDAAQKSADRRDAYVALERHISKDPDDVDALASLSGMTRRSAFASLYAGHMDQGPGEPLIDVDAGERDNWAIRLLRRDPSRLPNGIERQRDRMESYWNPVLHLADYWRAAFEAAKRLPPPPEVPAYPLETAHNYKVLAADGLSPEPEHARGPSRSALADPTTRAAFAVGSSEIVMMAVRLIEPGEHDPCTQCM